MAMRFLNIGYGNIVSAHRIIAIVSPESAPIKRTVQEAREHNALLDATYGRKTRAVIVMDDGRVSAFGTHEELLNTSEIYREVFESQKKGGDE